MDLSDASFRQFLSTVVRPSTVEIKNGDLPWTLRWGSASAPMLWLEDRTGPLRYNRSRSRGKLASTLLWVLPGSHFNPFRSVGGIEFIEVYKG